MYPATIYREIPEANLPCDCLPGNTTCECTQQLSIGRYQMRVCPAIVCWARPEGSLLHRRYGTVAGHTRMWCHRHRVARYTLLWCHRQTVARYTLLWCHRQTVARYTLLWCHRQTVARYTLLWCHRQTVARHSSVVSPADSS